MFGTSNLGGFAIPIVAASAPGLLQPDINSNIKLVEDLIKNLAGQNKSLDVLAQQIVDTGSYQTFLDNSEHFRTNVLAPTILQTEYFFQCFDGSIKPYSAYYLYNCELDEFKLQFGRGRERNPDLKRFLNTKYKYNSQSYKLIY
jgi:hypothetical protein